jgi:hypothetical protein
MIPFHIHGFSILVIEERNIRKKCILNEVFSKKKHVNCPLPQKAAWYSEGIKV